jgi:hypothetical protein
MKPLGKPVNNQVKSCDEVTANCVIWDGPNISADCLGIQIYQGDSIAPIIYNTYKNFCRLIEKTDLSQVDSSCIIDLASQPTNIVDLINLINEKLCENNIRIIKEETKAITEYSANLPYCLQIKSDTITITRLPLNEHLEKVATLLCDELFDLEDIKVELDPSGEIYSDLEDLDVLIQAQCNQVNNPITPICTAVGPPVPIPVEEAYALLEKAFCTFKNFTGTPEELFIAIARDCPNLNDLPALSNSGLMKDIYGWIDNPVNVAQSINNLWLTICDLRSALRNLLLGCCDDSPCLSFDVGYKLSFDPNNQYVDITFQDTYNVPPSFTPTDLSVIRDLDRTTAYAGGIIPGVLTTDFPTVGNLRVIINDGTAQTTIDTGQNIFYWMNVAATPGGPAAFTYRLVYPVGYDPTAPVKTLTIEFDYTYVNRIIDAIPSAGKIKYETLRKHPFVIGSRVDITNNTQPEYNFTDQPITQINSATEFTITTPTPNVPTSYTPFGNVILNSQDCDKCECCCTFSVTNGIY